MTTNWTQLESLRAAGAIEDVDLHFAHFVARLDGRDLDAVALAGCAVSHAAGAGHVCADLRAIAGQPLVAVDDDAPPAPLAPSLADWTDALRASRIVARPGEVKPLVLDDAGRLYLHRLWEDERCVADALIERAAGASIDVERLRADLALLFAAESPEQPNWQRVAAATAVLRRAAVISGGPGTGKTSTVVRVLALLARQHAKSLRIALAAPTGKAASRLLDAVRRAAADLPPGLLPADCVPTEARTLHRLLGRRRPGDTVAPKPLPFDVVVVDEASMVDLSLMARLVRALLPETRLILLGDKDQLASVEAGAVLADVCGPVPGFSPAMADLTSDVTGETVPAGMPLAEAPLRDAVVLLRHSYRFGAGSGIGRLAEAVNAGDGAGALAIMNDPDRPDVAWHPMATAADLTARIDEAVAAYLQFAHAVQGGADPAAVFRCFNAFRLLCAVRRGPFGVEAMNQRVAAALAQRRLIDPRARWYPGRPVLVTQNDYGVRLFNGDVGIALPDADGRLRVHFEAGDGSVRAVAPVRLPALETVFAMTVHKAQGSEFDDVVVLLPPENVRVVTRELLYTAVTRARRRVTVWGNPTAFADAVGRRVTRSSGLRDALWPSRA